MQYEIFYDENRVTVGDIMDMEDGNTRARVSVLGRHVKNGNGEYIEPEDGFKLLAKLTVPELDVLIDKFIEEMEADTDPN